MSISEKYGHNFEKEIHKLGLNPVEVNVEYMRAQLATEDSGSRWRSLVNTFELRPDREFVIATFTAMVCDSALGAEIEHAEQLRVLANNVGFETDTLESAMESDQLIEAAYAQAEDASTDMYKGFSEVACKMAIRAARGLWVARYAVQTEAA